MIDLDGYLTDSEHCISHQISRWLTKEQGVVRSSRSKKPLGPWVIQVTFKGPLEQFQPLFSDSLENCDPAQTPGIIETIRQKFLETLGPQPEGVILRTRCYRAGKSSMPGVHSKRTIGSGREPSGTIGTVQLEQHNTQLMNSMNGLIADIRAIAVSQNTLIAEMAQSQATLATARSAGTTSADVGGLGGLLTVAGMAFLWPMISDAVKLPEGVTLPDLIKLVQARVQGAISMDATPGLPQVGPPPSILESAEHSPQAETQGAQPSADRETITSALQAVKNDPELRQALVQEVMSDPDLKSALIAAYMSSLK